MLSSGGKGGVALRGGGGEGGGGGGALWSHTAKGGGAQKKRGITVFSYPPPLGGVRPEKKYPTPMCKKVSQPQFFSKEHHRLLFHIV